MKDYSKLTNKELFNELDNLRTELEREESMDGSGELGERIYKMFEPFFNAIYSEMDKRGLSENDYPKSLIGCTETKINLLDVTGDVFIKYIYPMSEREFLTVKKYDEYYKVVREKFILNEDQWEEVLMQWDRKEYLGQFPDISK